MLLFSEVDIRQIGEIPKGLPDLHLPVFTVAQWELMGQGIGNLASGLCGGIPGAGATMGTVVNIQAGGRRPLVLS